MLIKEILQKSVEILTAKKISSANLDAEILLLYTLAQLKNKPKNFNNDRSWLYAHDNYTLSKKQENIYLKLIKRREKFEPIAYITRKKEFFCLEFYVDKNVLIPRPETEILVENVLKDILTKTEINRKIVIADIGTGSGAIAISIAKNLKNQNKLILSVQPGSEPICFYEQQGKQGVPIASKNNWRASPLAVALKSHNDNFKNITIYATDISQKALSIAKKNAKIHNCDKDIIFKKGDLLKAIPKNTKIDYLLANLPYGGKDYLYKRLKDKSRLAHFFGIKYEPSISIFAENNGMIHFENFFKTVAEHLAKNAKIFLESDPHQISAIKKLAKKYLPAHKVEIFKDLRGLNRITKIEII